MSKPRYKGGVVLFTDGNSTYPEPELDKYWPDDDKVLWHADVTTARTGVNTVIKRVSEGADPLYQVKFGDTFTAGYRYSELLSLLSGFEAGASETTKKIRNVLERAFEGLE